MDKHYSLHIISNLVQMQPSSSLLFSEMQLVECLGRSAWQTCYSLSFLSPCFLNWFINPKIPPKYFWQKNSRNHAVCVHSSPGRMFFKICFSKVVSGEFFAVICVRSLSREKMQYLFTSWPLTEIKMECNIKITGIKWSAKWNRETSICPIRSSLNFYLLYLVWKFPPLFSINYPSNCFHRRSVCFFPLYCFK